MSSATPRLSVLRTLSGPVGRSPLDRAVYHGARILLLLLVAAAVCVLFPPLEQNGGDRFQPGRVAEQDVVAQIPYDVPKTPAELERDRAEARASVPPTFDFVPSAADTMAARLSDFFDKLDGARQMGDTAALHEVLRSRSIAAQPAQVSLLAEQRVFDLVKRTALRAAREILPNGVADNSELQSVTTAAITVREGEQDQVGAPVAERSVPTKDVLSSRAVLERAVGLLPASASPDAQEMLRLVLIQFIEYTYRLDETATALDRDAASRSVSVSKESVDQGETLIRAGEPITQDSRERLAAYEAELKTRGMLKEGSIEWRPLAGAALLDLLVLGVFGLLLYFYRRDVYQNFRWLMLLAALMTAYFGAAAIVAFNDFPTELLPIAFVALSTAVLWEGRMALVLVLTLAALTAAQTPFDSVHVLVTTLVGGAAAALSVHAVRRRAQAWVFGAIVAVAYAATLLAFALLGVQEADGLWTALAATTGNAILSSVLAMGFIPLFELVTGITTDQTLLEWADPNRPLLKRLSMEAPGTYAHTINVANLADSACTAIGANGLLCRVGLYYHDVGKMLNPQYYVENQIEGRNPHDRLDPDVSAAIVKEHVTEGLRLAREAKVPEAVAAFIPQHHGTQRIGFFFDRARELYGEEELDPEEFTYPGPKPQSRETAVAMLADSVESAARALQEPTPDRLRDLIRSIVEAKMRDGQLDQSPITLREIGVVEDQFVKMLSSLYHQRMDYPQTRHLTRKPAAAEAAR
jgi:putative nucleotidyltransferase with HDIG domain